MMKKLISSLVLSSIAISANAGLLFETTGVEKRGEQKALSIGDSTWYADGPGTLLFDGDQGVYQANLRLPTNGPNGGTNWQLTLHVTKSAFDGSERPRCYGGGTACDTTDWFKLVLDTSQENILERVGNVPRHYEINEAWGQFGTDAGGVFVTPQEGLAGGFWFSDTTLVNKNGDRLDGGIGDLNFYADLIDDYSVTDVAEPGTLALLGLGMLGLAYSRKRQA